MGTDTVLQRSSARRRVRDAVVAAAGARPPAELHPSQQHRWGDKATVLACARAPGPRSLSNAALRQLPTRCPGTQRSILPGRAAKHLLGSGRSLSTEPLPCLARPFLHGTSLLAAPLCSGCSLPRGGRLLPFPLSKNGVFEDGSSIVGTAATCPEPPAALHCLPLASRLTACSSPLQRSHGGKADPVTQTLLTIAAEPQ